jgi:hypothetical protein
MMKIESSTTGTTIAAIDDAKTVVINGTLKTPMKELKGTVGLSRMAVLQGYLKFPPFKEDGATVEITTTERDGEDIPTEITFSSPDGHASSYRFMHKDVINEQIQVPNLKDQDTWDVVITNTDALMTDLSYFNGVLGSFEPVFTAKTDGTDLNFYIGSGATDRATVPVAKGVSGTLNGATWRLVETLAILKLAKNAGECTLSFANRGVLKIEMETTLGTYEYLLPAQAI